MSQEFILAYKRSWGKSMEVIPVQGKVDLNLEPAGQPGCLHIRSDGTVSTDGRSVEFRLYTTSTDGTHSTKPVAIFMGNKAQIPNHGFALVVVFPKSNRIGKNEGLKHLVGISWVDKWTYGSQPQ